MRKIGFEQLKGINNYPQILISKKQRCAINSVVADLISQPRGIKGKRYKNPELQLKNSIAAQQIGVIINKIT